MSKKPLQIDVIHTLISLNSGIKTSQIQEETSFSRKSIDRWTRKLLVAREICFADNGGWKLKNA